MEHRARISLGPPAPRNDAEGGTAFMRRRAASVSGRAGPRKSILKQHIPLPAHLGTDIAFSDGRPSLAASSSTGDGDYHQPLSDVPSELRAMRKSEGGSRRVSFNTNTTVRIFSQGSPSPVRVSPPNRAVFASEQGYDDMSPLQKKLIGSASQRSSDSNASPRRSRFRQPSMDHAQRSPSRSPRRAPTTTFAPAPEENDDMDIADESAYVEQPSVNSDMSMATTFAGTIPSQRPSMLIDDDADMSIVEDSMEMHARRDSLSQGSQVPLPATRLSIQSRVSDMSIAVTEPTGRRPSTLIGDISNMSIEQGEPAEEPSTHEFLVPLGQRLPRTDTHGNILSPTKAEKDKAAALAALAAFGGENPDDEEEDDEDDLMEVVSVRAGSEMSIEDAERRLRAASQDIALEEPTSSTMSLDDPTGPITGADATVNITALRKSLLPSQLPSSPIRPASPLRPSAIPVPKSPSRPAANATKLSVFTPATPSGPIRSPSRPPVVPPKSPSASVSAKSPARPRPAFTANFAPPSVSPRKRALSVPSPAPSPAKRRAISVEPASPSKARSAVPISAITKPSFRPVSSSAKPTAPKPTPAQSTISVARNPFLDDPQLVAPSPRAVERAPPTTTVSNVSGTNKENISSVSAPLPATSKPLPRAEKPQVQEPEPAQQQIDIVAENPPLQPSHTETSVAGSQDHSLASKTANPVTLAPSSRPSITPFSAAPVSRGAGRMSAAIRARRSSVAPGRGRQSVISVPTIQEGDAEVDDVSPPNMEARPQEQVQVLAQQSPRQVEAPVPHEPSPEPQAPLVVISEPTEPPASVGAPSAVEPEQPAQVNKPRVSTSTYASRRQSISTSNVEKPRRRMSFAPRARLSVAPDDLPPAVTTKTEQNGPDLDPGTAESTSQKEDAVATNHDEIVQPLPEAEPRRGQSRLSVNRRMSLAARRSRRSSVLPSAEGMEIPPVTNSEESNLISTQSSNPPDSQSQSQESHRRLSVQLSPVRQGRRRSTFARASLAPMTKPPVMPKTISTQSSSAPVSQPQMMHLMDFLQAAGHRFQNIPVDLPVQWRQEDSDELVDTGYQQADVVQAIAINYPQLDAYEDFVAGMREDVASFEADSQAILVASEMNPPPITQAWLQGGNAEREAIITETKICRANAAFQAQATWYPWRLENTARDLERAVAIREDLDDVAAMFDDYDSGLPNIINTLQEEHDRLRAELDAELAISQELESCDQDELEDLRQELEAQTEELKEKERAERAIELEVQSLEARQKDMLVQVQEGEKALESDEAKIAQSGDNTEIGALRLENQLNHLQWLLLWRLIRLDSDMMELVYDSWFSVQIVCKDFIVQGVKLTSYPTLSDQHSQFPITNEILLALGHRRLSQLNGKTPLSVVRALDSLWASGAQLNMQLRLLKLFPLKLSREGEYGLAAKAKILLKYKSGRADVTFHLTDDIICDCPARIAEITYDITLNYGQDVTVEDVRQRLDSFLAAIPPEEQSFSVLGSACVDLQAIGSE